MAFFHLACFFSPLIIETKIPINIKIIVSNNGTSFGISIKWETNILIPIRIKMIARECLIYLNLSTISTRQKNKALSPKIAKMFELYTIKVLCVIAKMAGILSIANIRSMNSIVINAMNKGVKNNFAKIRINMVYVYIVKDYLQSNK